LDKLGITNQNIFRNLSTAELYEIALLKNKPADPFTRTNSIADNGALIAYSGLKTGRSPKDKRIVSDETTKNEIWWGDVNMPINEDHYE
jgi:phosphoenolpyruvate carboxykinase (ATP)